MSIEEATTQMGVATEAMNTLTATVNVKKATLDASVADAEEARDLADGHADRSENARDAAVVSETNSAQSATVATAAAQALIGTEGIIPTASEILWLASKPQGGVNALGFLDTGARLLSGVSERALLRYGEDNETLNFMLLDGGVDGVRLDFTQDDALFSDTAGTTPATAGDSLARVNDQSPNAINSSQPNAALQGKVGKAPKEVRNLLINTATLSTQSRTVTAVSHTLSFTGTGTVTLSGASTAGPLVGTGASDRVNLTFTPTAGTLTLTVSGSVTSAQLEIGAQSDYQAVGASNLDVTESGVTSYTFYRPDLSDDVLPLTVPAIDGDILIAGKNGTWIEPAAPSAGAFNVGPTTYTGGTPGILRAVGDITGVELIDKTLSASERERIIRYYQGRGAKGLLVPGPTPIPNGDFSSNDLTNWIDSSSGTGDVDASSGSAVFTSVDNSNRGILDRTVATVAGVTYQLFVDITAAAASTCAVWVDNNQGFAALAAANSIGAGKRLVQFRASSSTTWVRVFGTFAAGSMTLASLSLLRPEEDW